jgi:hypothetical protein
VNNLIVSVVVQVPSKSGWKSGRLVHRNRWPTM